MHLLLGACMGKERLVYPYRPVMPTGKSRYNRQRSRTFYMYLYIPPPNGMCSYALMHTFASLGRERTLNMHGGGLCHTFMYTHMYNHELILLSDCGPLRTLIVVRWLGHAGAHVQTCLAGLKSPCRMIL